MWAGKELQAGGKDALRTSLQVDNLAFKGRPILLCRARARPQKIA